MYPFLIPSNEPRKSHERATNEPRTAQCLCLSDSPKSSLAPNVCHAPPLPTPSPPVPPTFASKYCPYACCGVDGLFLPFFIHQELHPRTLLLCSSVTEELHIPFKTHIQWRRLLTSP